MTGFIQAMAELCRISVPKHSPLPISLLITNLSIFISTWRVGFKQRQLLNSE